MSVAIDPVESLCAFIQRAYSQQTRCKVALKLAMLPETPADVHERYNEQRRHHDTARDALR